MHFQSLQLISGEGPAQHYSYESQTSQKGICSCFNCCVGSLVAMTVGMSSQSSTKLAVPASIREAEGMGRGRRVRGSYFGDSKHERRDERRSATDGHYCHHGSS